MNCSPPYCDVQIVTHPFGVFPILQPGWNLCGVRSSAMVVVTRGAFRRCLEIRLTAGLGATLACLMDSTPPSWNHRETSQGLIERVVSNASSMERPLVALTVKILASLNESSKKDLNN